MLNERKGKLKLKVEKERLSIWNGLYEKTVQNPKKKSLINWKCVLEAGK
jgi:hypothetical protein